MIRYGRHHWVVSDRTGSSSGHLPRHGGTISAAVVCEDSCRIRWWYDQWWSVWWCDCCREERGEGLVQWRRQTIISSCFKLWQWCQTKTRMVWSNVTRLRTIVNLNEFLNNKYWSGSACKSLLDINIQFTIDSGGSSFHRWGRYWWMNEWTNNLNINNNTFSCFVSLVFNNMVLLWLRRMEDGLNKLVSNCALLHTLINNPDPGNL